MAFGDRSCTEATSSLSVNSREDRDTQDQQETEGMPRGGNRRPRREVLQYRPTQCDQRSTPDRLLVHAPSVM